MEVNSLKKLQLYLEHIPGLVVIDMEGIVVYTNHQCAGYFGVERSRMLGKHIKEDILDDTRMLEKLYIDEPEMVFYNSRMGIGISVVAPLFDEGKRVGLLEYDAVQESRQLYDLSEDYRKFLDRELMNLQQDISGTDRYKYNINSIVGNSPAVIRLKEEIIAASKSLSTVVITGETGTGKELVAHSIHNLSRRRDKEIVKINAAALPENLIESELFGYESGAFTGAKKQGNIGKFEQANGGTLFIDEINQMPLQIQPKLLRAIQEREVDRIGGAQSVPVDVRIIAATNQDLKALVKQGRFREDLYYRFNVVEIQIPPLRERAQDIELLVSSRIQALNRMMGTAVIGVDRDALEALKSHRWPGNVRELFNGVERAMNYAEGPLLTLKDFKNLELSESRNQYRDSQGDGLIDLVRNNAERELIREILQKFNGSKTKTAEYLGIARPLLYQKMKRLEIKT